MNNLNGEWFISDLLSPAHMCLVPVLSNPEHRRLRKEIKKVVSNLSPVTLPLQKDDEVFVYDECSSMWERAMALSNSWYVHKTLQHRVLLVDRGAIVHTSRACYAPHSFFTKLPFAALELRLDGLLPRSSKETKSGWSAKTYCELLEKLKNLRVKIKVNYQTNGVCYGDLYYPTGNKELHSLSTLLVDTCCGVVDKDAFQKKYFPNEESTLLSPESFSVKTEVSITNTSNHFATEVIHPSRTDSNAENNVLTQQTQSDEISHSDSDSNCSFYSATSSCTSSESESEISPGNQQHRLQCKKPFVGINIPKEILVGQPSNLGIPKNTSDTSSSNLRSGSEKCSEEQRVVKNECTCEDQSLSVHNSCCNQQETQSLTSSIKGKFDVDSLFVEFHEKRKKLLNQRVTPVGTPNSVGDVVMKFLPPTPSNSFQEKEVLNDSSSLTDQLNLNSLKLLNSEDPALVSGHTIAGQSQENVSQPRALNEERKIAPRPFVYGQNLHHEPLIKSDVVDVGHDEPWSEGESPVICSLARGSGTKNSHCIESPTIKKLTAIDKPSRPTSADKVASEEEELVHSHKSTTSTLDKEVYQPHDFGAEDAVSPQSTSSKKRGFQYFIDMNEKDGSHLRDQPKFRGMGARETRFSRIFVKSPFGDVNPVLSFHESPINDYIQSVLRRQQIEIFPIVSYSIPAILRMKNTAVISGPRSGKTYGYVLPIMHNLFLMANENKTPGGYGPIAIILCPGSFEGYRVLQLCKKFSNFGCLPGQIKTRIMMAHGGDGTQEAKILGELCEGCEVLVTTPLFLVRALKNEIFTNLDRLRWMVLDGTNRLLQTNFESEVIQIKNQCDKKRVDNIQWIVVGEHYTAELRSFLRSIGTTTLLFGSHMEAALHADIKPTIVVTPSDKKIDALIDQLKSTPEDERIVIVCRISPEAQKLGELLTARGFGPLVALSGMTAPSELFDINKVWERQEGGALLVCTDDVLVHLWVSDATLLVHYSLPSKYSSTFDLRFSTLMANYPNDFSQCKKNNRVKSIIMLDEDTTAPVPKIIKMLQRLGCEVNYPFTEYAQQVQINKELEKRNMSLCRQLIGRGECQLGPQCAGRHVLIRDLDQPDSRTSGELVFRPLAAIGGASFAAHLISARPTDGSRHDFIDLTSKIKQDLAEYFKNSEERFNVALPKVGQVCAVKFKGEFFRATIEQIFKKVPKGSNKIKIAEYIQVKLLDAGHIWKINVKDLWELPLELALLPPQAVEIHLVGLIPRDFDLNWSVESIEKLEKAIKEPLDKNATWRGRVRMAFKSALVLDEVVVMQDMSCVLSSVTSRDLIQEVIRDECAVKNPEHLTRLIKLGDVVGIYPPRIPDSQVKNLKPQWAHFSDVVLPYVRFSCARTFNQVFLQYEKFRVLLVSLEKECQKEAEKIALERKKFHFRIGDLALANTADGEWSRVRVEDIVGNEVIYFAVDHGEVNYVPLDKLVPISPRLVSTLPFQAIECSLGGIQPPEVHEVEILDEIYEFTHDGEEKCFAAVERLQEQGSLTQGPKYAINLMNAQGQSFNKYLADKEGLTLTESADNFLVDMEPVKLTASESEDHDSAKKLEDLEHVDMETIDLTSIDNSNEDFYERLYKCFVYTISHLDEIIAENTTGLIGNSLLLHGSGISPQKIWKKVADRTDSTGAPEPVVDNVESLAAPIFDCQLERLPGLRPRTIWQQDAYVVQLKFDVTDAHHTRLCTDIRCYSFTCLDGSGQLYRASCELFGAIKFKEAKMRVTPREVILVFPKMVTVMWPRLSFHARDPTIVLNPNAAHLDEDLEYDKLTSLIRVDTPNFEEYNIDSDDSLDIDDIDD